MSAIHRSGRVALGIGAVFAFALAAPVAVTAEEQDLAAAPAAPMIAPGPAVDANHAATAVYEALNYGPSRDATRSSRSVIAPGPSLNANRAATAVYEALNYGPKRG
jgi:hypothetical protein